MPMGSRALARMIGSSPMKNELRQGIRSGLPLRRQQWHTAAIALWLLVLAFLILSCKEKHSSKKEEEPDVVRSCASGWANCMDDPDGLCRTQIASDPKHCGSCGTACDEELSCIRGHCIRPVIDVAVSIDHACALYADGRVACWGNNNRGELGIGNTEDHPYPVWVPGVSDAIAIDAAFGSTCVMHEDRGLSCWGGYLDTDTHEEFPTRPRRVDGLDEVESFVLSPLMPGRGLAIVRGGRLIQWEGFTEKRLTFFEGTFQKVYRGGVSRASRWGDRVQVGELWRALVGTGGMARWGGFYRLAMRNLPRWQRNMLL